MLKQYLSLLLSKFYSKQESGEVAKQSYPSTAATTIQLTPSDGVTNKEMSYTPPSDGYIVLRDQGLPQRSSYLISGQYAEGVARGDNILFDFLMMTPVLKGVPVTIRYCGKDSVAQFIKNIGGGRKIIRLTLQGGVLCRLSHWYSSLRKNSCKVRKGGLQTNQQFLFKILLNYLLLQMEKVTHLRCRTQGSLTSEVMEFGLPILEGSTLSILGRLRMGTFLFGLTPKKVKNSPTQLGNQTSSLLPIFVYTKSKVTIDLMFGGASC
jgi:hypothetical protein